VALSTTSDYGAAARILLQDQTAPLRYPDTDLALALSIALEEAHRLRPDLFLGITSVPTYTALDTTAVTMDERYRMALVYYIAGWTQMRDDEYTQDGRAGVFLQKFVAILTGAG
jgi:hypothetical protein